MTRTMACLAPLLLLAGCATTMTAEQVAARRASCEAMEGDMGLGQRHDHGEMKGQGRNPMNLTHEYCMAILGRR